MRTWKVCIKVGSINVLTFIVFDCYRQVKLLLIYKILTILCSGIKQLIITI